MNTFLRKFGTPMAFIVIGVLLLGTIWVATHKFGTIERETSERAMVTSVAELADTYEAQVARTLREIGHTMRMIRHEVAGGHGQVLAPLQANDLLPSSLLFTVAYTGADGVVVESTHALAGTDLSGFDFFEAQRHSDAPSVGQPWQHPQTGEAVLPFSHRIETIDGGFAGIVLVLVDAAYFVSAYDSAKFGDHGVLGLVGADGVTRVDRRGDDIRIGEAATASALIGQLPEAGGDAAMRVVDHDGTRYLVRLQPLFDFPLVAMVGLSEPERLAAAAGAMRGHVLRAVVASAVVVLVLALLGQMSWQVQLGRARAMAEQAEHATQVEHLAFHDSLTGLPNRALFARFVEESIRQSQRYRRQLAILLLDLDRFKVVNDTLGHNAGDEMLQEIAHRLKHDLRESDFVARLGGDEFVVLLPEYHDEAEVAEAAQRILNAVNGAIRIDGREVRMTASIGVALAPADGLDEETLLKHADIAMYHAKSQGKNAFKFYSSKLSESAVDRLAIEAGLGRAIENGEFVLHYQARVDAANDRIVGAEALLRWHRPGIGMVPPLSFIPIAEETGQIVAIGNWVLREACRQCMEWHRAGFSDFRVAVNLSARQFQDEGMLAEVRQVLTDTGMKPELLEFEITESMLMLDVERASSILGELRTVGTRTSIDDFGTGYSSLSTLKQFPLDVIKIDGSFVRGALEDRQDRSLTEAIVAVGHALDLTIVAEGVETAGHAELVRTLGCDELQGYHINRPLPALEFERFMVERERPRMRSNVVHLSRPTS